MKKTAIYLWSIMILGTISCKSLYGIKQQEKFDEDKINTFYNRLNTSIFQKATADSNYITAISILLKHDSAYQYYHLQPLQVLYYNEIGDMISYHVNCNAGGFPKLNWNRNGLFEAFPPKTQTKPNHIVTQNFLENNLALPSKKGADYTVFVFWNLLLEKQSRLLLGQVEKNLKLTDKKVNVVLVNNDKWYLK